MLVKNTILALLVAAPAFALPVKTAKSTAVTKPTTPSSKVTKQSVAAAERKESSDEAQIAKLNKQRAKLMTAAKTDKAKVKSLKTTELKQEKTEKAAKVKAAKAKALKTKLSKAPKTPKTPKTPTSAKSLKTGSAAKHQKAPVHALKHSLKSGSTASLHSHTGAGVGSARNRHNLKIDTSASTLRKTGHGQHTGSARTPHTGSARTPHTGKSSLMTGGSRTGSSLNTGSSLHSSLKTGSTRHSAGLTPNSGLSTGNSRHSFSGGESPMGTGRSQHSFGGSSGFGTPRTGSSMVEHEKISYTPTSGGGYTEDITFNEQPARLARRATPAPATPSTPTTPLSASASILPHHSRKAVPLHKHTLGEKLQLNAMLLEAERVVQGLEKQLNKAATPFSNLKMHKIHKLKVPTTPGSSAKVTPPSSPVAAKAT